MNTKFTQNNEHAESLEHLFDDLRCHDSDHPAVAAWRAGEPSHIVVKLIINDSDL